MIEHEEWFLYQLGLMMGFLSNEKVIAFIKARGATEEHARTAYDSLRELWKAMVKANDHP